MMNLIAAALVAAAPAPSAPDAHANMAPMQYEQHEAMKDCCKDCCKDMAAKHGDHASEHSEHPQH